MVPIPESPYFPPLDKCLERDDLLISWRTVFSKISISNETNVSELNPVIKNFLSDPFSLKLLERPYDPYSFATAQTKSAFETKTSAINVTPTSKNGYNIEEIKEDALWLSKEAHIDELSALRMVVLEFQDRPRENLIRGFTEEESLSIRDAVGVGSELPSLLPTIAVTNADPAEFASQDRRRKRFLQCYLSERRHLIKCASLFLQAALDRTSEKVDLVGHNGVAWIDTVGLGILQGLQKSEGGLHGFLVDSIASLKASFGKLDQGSLWFAQDGGREELEIEWLTSRITEAIHTMETIFCIMHFENNVPSSKTVVAWFQFAATYGFFDEFNSPYSAMQSLIPALQSLVAVITLAMISPQTTINTSPGTEDLPAPLTPYVSDLDVVKLIQESLENAATVLSVNASPAMLAWSILLAETRRNSTARKDAREQRQSDRAVEEYEAGDEENESSTQAMRRRSSVGSDISLEPGVLDRLIDSISHQEGDVIVNLGTSAVDGCKVFDFLTNLCVYFESLTASRQEKLCSSKIRSSALDLVRLSFGVVEYSPEVVISSLAAFTGGYEFWDILNQQQLPAINDPIGKFLRDEIFVDLLLAPAKGRYPYESLPFLQLIRAIATSLFENDEGMPFAVKLLERMNSVTFILPEDFRDYETIHEEENTNTIEITVPIPLFTPRRISDKTWRSNQQSSALVKSSGDFLLRTGTQGRIVSETGPKVSIFFLQYSCLKYFGKLLETSINGHDSIDATTNLPLGSESTAEIIGILANLLVSCNKLNDLNGTAANVAAMHILEEVSEPLGRNRDVISVIWSIFEEEVHNQATGQSRRSLDVLISTIYFIHAILPIYPGRVWPLMGRSELLEIDGRGGRIDNIVERTEVASTRYEFLISCAYLYDGLVEDSVRNAAIRKLTPTSINRFNQIEDIGTGVSDQILSKVLLSFTRATVRVFSASSLWRFADEEQRLVLSGKICSILNKTMEYAYGTGASSDAKSNPIRSLSSSASHVVETFLVTASDSFRLQPVFTGLLDGFFTPSTTVESRRTLRWIQHVRAIITLTTTIIRIGTLRDQSISSQLEDRLFKMSPLLIRVSAVHEAYHSAIINLLQALVVSAATHIGEPTSLFGYLSPTASDSFMQLLFSLGEPVANAADVAEIWRFASAVVSSRQQWVSIYLITGQPPRGSSPQASSTKNPPRKSLLRIALSRLSTLQSSSPLEAIAMLEFVSLTQNFWPWAMADLQGSADIANSISTYVANLGQVSSINSIKSLESCYNCRIAGYIAEILAMYLYHSRQVGNKKAATSLVDKLGYYSAFGSKPSAYNSSLHANLKRNFESRYSGCGLDDFKKTELKHRDFGRNYLYDIPLAGKMLCRDQAWEGRRNDGLAEELAIANINLSLVDAQVSLLHGWKLLAIELGSSLPDNVDLQRIFISTIKSNLIAINQSQHAENLFARQNETRAEFTLVLMQHLSKVKTNIPERLKILPAIWETISIHGASFTTASVSDDMPYYRTLLKILFLAINDHASDKSNRSKNQKNVIVNNTVMPQSAAMIIQLSSPTTRLILTIIDTIVAKGFRDLVSAIHEQSKEILPEDIGLVTAILRACLQVPSVDDCYGEIIEFFARSDTARVVAALFSWSDQLAIEGDPIYGELSVSFLLSLSSIPPLAEQLAAEGILGQLSTAAITEYMRRRNISPFSESRGAQRCYMVWVRGFLPLLLNILAAVGSTIATEVSIFLNEFPNLLKASESPLQSPPLGESYDAMQPVTLTSVSELQSLSLINFALTGFRLQQTGITEVPALKWNATGVLEGVDYWLNLRITLRERIVAVSPRESELKRLKPVNSAEGLYENRLEELIVEEMIGIRDILTGGQSDQS